MKKIERIIKISAFMLLLLTGEIYAQRYLPGLRGLQVTGGTVDGFNGYSAEIAYSRYNKNTNRWLIGAGILNRETNDRIGKIPVTQFAMEGGYYVNFLTDPRKVFFFSLGLSAITGYETVNWGEKILPDGGMICDRSRFIYGGALTFEIESYVTDRWAILLNVKERAVWGNDTDRFHNEINIGLKYIIN